LEHSWIYATAHNNEGEGGHRFLLIKLRGRLDLNLNGSQSDFKGKSRIWIVLSAPESVGAAIADARKVADNIAAGKAATVDGAQGYIGDAQATISQFSSLAVLGTVFDKIDLFVKIVDNTASVCGLVFI